MASKRDYKAEHQRRNARARGRGFASYAEQRKFATAVQKPDDLARLPEDARNVRTQALAALRIARRERISVELAAAEAGVAMDAVRFYAAPALAPRKGGITRPRAADRLLRLRPLVVKTPAGPEVLFVALRGSKAAERAQTIFAAQWAYVHSGADRAAVERFAGTRIGGYEVETDPERLDRLALTHEFDVEEAYRAVIA